MTPADELHAAAEMLRNRLVSAATAGPWHVVEYDTYHRNLYEFDAGLGTTTDNPDIAGHGYEGGGFDRLCDAQYAAAMHPGVGAALSDWLDYTAQFADLYGSLAYAMAGDCAADPHPDASIRHALTVARTILGSQP